MNYDIPTLLKEALITGPVEKVNRTEELSTGTTHWSEVKSKTRVHNSQVAHCADEDDADLIVALINTALTENASDGGQDRKFAFRNGQFVNRVSGEAIPLDEPIVIFRARDRHSEHVLRYYLSMLADPHHQQAVRERMGEFAAYRELNPDKMKEPGITHDIRLNNEAPSNEPHDRAGVKMHIPTMRHQCTCVCHTQPGVVHSTPCCTP